MSKAFCVLFSLTSFFVTCGGVDETAAYENVGAIYTSADRTASYQFMEKIAKYQYTFPVTRLKGQRFPLDYTDLIPNAVIHDCSDVTFRCLAMDTHVMAVPRKLLRPDSAFVVAGNSVSVVKCLRGYEDICQVALLKSECFYSLSKHGCVPLPEIGVQDQSVWRTFFIYNEDFGVTSFGIGADSTKSLVEMQDNAKDYILVGDNGLLRP